jgi:hypothetical protein
MTVPALPCTTMSITPAGLCVTMPGGATICLSYPSSGLASASAGTKALLGQINVALAPLMPFFKVIETLDAAKDLLFSPDQFFVKLDEMLAMAPQFTVPVMIANALDILILYLQGLHSQLQAFVLQQTAILASATKAAALVCAPLQLTVDCANAQLALQMQGISDGVAPLNALVTVINLLLTMAGGPSVDPFADLGPDPAAALAPLQASITALQVVRALPFFPA